MSENTVKFKNQALVSVFFSGALCLASLFLSSWTPVYVADLLLYSAFNTFIFSILLFNEFRLSYNAELENEDQQRVKKSVGASDDLFDESDESLMLSARALKTWRSYVLPAFSIAYGIFAIIWLAMKWNEWKVEIDLKNIVNQLPAAACAGALGVCYFLVGAFYSGASRRQGGTRLRPFSAWAYCSALIAVAVMAVLFFISEEQPHLDKYINRGIIVLFIVLAIELSLNYLVDLYRPRFQQNEKSILESRLLALFTDSGNIAGNIAHALDYQFGIKITEQGFYQFLRKKFLPLFAIQLFSLYILSCFSVIEAGNRGLRETFGSIDEKAEELQPGLYLKMPWPFAKIHSFPVDQIQTIEIGQQTKRNLGPEAPPDPSKNNAVTVTEDVKLWSKSEHNDEGKEEINYIISRKADTVDKRTSKALADISMISVRVPIHYKIKSTRGADGVSPLYKYLMRFEDGQASLKSLASHVVMKYLSGADYFDFLGKDREAAGKELQSDLQEEVNRLGLGIEIVFLALESTHPPGKVSDSYDDVIAAEFDKKSLVYLSKLFKSRVLSQASIKAKNAVSAAQAETAMVPYVEDGKEILKPMKIAIAQEASIRYKAQLESFKAQPYLYALINYLDVLEKTLANTPKILIDGSKSGVNIQFDLKPKLSPGLEGLVIPE
ncbi:MAG: hypothetical protein HRT88_12015 [Lentisphaeraceae bacterium]|nr:hypothetical protein [Lentisphaeraceae bacterium]